MENQNWTAALHDASGWRNFRRLFSACHVVELFKRTLSICEKKSGTISLP
jgi:hypothetical protein